MKLKELTNKCVRVCLSSRLHFERDMYKANGTMRILSSGSSTKSVYV